MGLVVKPFNFSNGTVADGLEVNADFDTLYTLVNGNIDSANIKVSDNFPWTGLHTFLHQKIRYRDFGGARFYLLNTATLAADRNISLPALTADDTFVFQDQAQTLTSKILTSPTINGGTLNSSTLVTPAIGSFSNAQHNHLDAAGGGALSLPTSAITSGTFADARIAASNVTQHQASLSLAASQITSGTLPVARGGTGVTTATGSGGSVVLSNGPTILSPTLSSGTVPAASALFFGSVFSSIQIDAGLTLMSVLSQGNLRMRAAGSTLILGASASNLLILTSSLLGSNVPIGIAQNAPASPATNTLYADTMVKAYGNITSAGGIDFGVGIASVSNPSAGIYNITLTNPFNTGLTGYTVVATVDTVSSGTLTRVATVNKNSTNSFSVFITEINESDAATVTLVNEHFNFIAIGPQ